MEEITTTIWDFGKEIFTNGLLAFAIESGVILVVGWLVHYSIKKAIDKTVQHNGSQKMPLHFLWRIIRFIIWAVCVFNILSGVKYFKGFGTAILGATSVFSVVIGLAAQESFGNFIAGFFLAMYHPFNVGDNVLLKEKNIAGTVKEITFRHTILTTVENTKLIIPNSVMNTAIIEDRAFGQRYYTKYMQFDIGYDSDIDLAIEIIQKEALKVENYLDIRSKQEKEKNQEPFHVRIDEFNASGVQLTFPIYTKNLGLSMRAASDLRKALLKEFQKNGIEIPYTKVQILEDNSSK